MESYLEKLSAFYSNLKIDGIPEPVMDKAKLSLLDYLFVYVVGFHKGTLTQAILDYVKHRKKNFESSIMLTGMKADTELAAFASGLIAHSVELDDGHRFGTAHPAVVVIPAALAEAEKQNATLGELLKAIVTGYDVMLRLSKAINPSHLKRGFHSTSTTGTIGSAAAVASIMKYDEPGMAHALSISGFLSAGLQEMLHGNPSIKSFQVGRSCQSGVLAAQFVEYGGKGPASLFEGQHGWIKAMTDSFNENDLMDELGNLWEILNTYTKLYPTCRHCHHAIDLAIDAYNNGIRIHDISKIKIKTYSVGISEVGLIKNPDTIQDAMFSVVYAVLIALKYGYVIYEDMKRHLDDEYLQRLSSKIEIESDEVMDEEYPQERGSILEIVTTSGKTHILSNKLPKGEPETSLDRKEYLLKFTRITKNYMAEKQVEELFENILKMDLNQSITSILSCFEKQNEYQT